MAPSFVIRGNLCFSENPDRIRIIEDGFLAVENGRIAGVYRTLPEQYAGLKLRDCSGCLIIPGLTDLHIHAPQFAYRGLGMDMELLEWLNTYAFPEESKYRDLAYADAAYSLFARHLHESATTRACVFATVHPEATELLMEKLNRTGLVTYVGKVCMDRNCPDYIREPSPEKSLADTEEWILKTRSAFPLSRPILTPRFLPSCTDALLEGLGKLREKYGLPVQSHLSENPEEISWVRDLAPESRFYGDAYDRFGLFGGQYPCIMAHCVYSGKEETDLIRRNGVFVAHSPESNVNLSSGVAPVSRYLDDGLNVGLASDVAGGSNENLFWAMIMAIQSSKLRWRLLDSSIPALTFERAFYAATMGGGAFFGKVGTFAPGYEADLLVLDDSSLDHPQTLTVRERLERYIYLSESKNIYAKYVRGRKIL